MNVPLILKQMHELNEKLKQERNESLVQLRSIANRVNRGESRPASCTWRENQVWDILESVFRRNGA